MPPERVTDSSVARRLLAEIGVRPRKQLGQNFLVDPSIVTEIGERLRAKRPGGVVEIGPGLGALTEVIADVSPSIIAVEIDPRLANGLRERLHDRANVSIRTDDVLTYDFSSGELEQPIWVVGSLPYRITTPILKHLIDQREGIVGACLITQWEVAEKIASSPGKDGSALGVFVQAYASVSAVRRIRRGSFFPIPDVDSAYWEIEFLPEPRFSASDDAFFAVVRTLYRNRRKMVRRGLRDLLDADRITSVLAQAGIDETARGDTLSMNELDCLAGALGAVSADG